MFAFGAVALSEDQKKLKIKEQVCANFLKHKPVSIVYIY